MSIVVAVVGAAIVGDVCFPIEGELSPNYNINHKELRRTANEYAEERRIYKDLISKNNNVDCKKNTAMLIVLREN